jgi:hypothetical protein
MGASMSLDPNKIGTQYILINLSDTKQQLIENLTTILDGMQVLSLAPNYGEAKSKTIQSVTVTFGVIQDAATKGS